MLSRLGEVCDPKFWVAPLPPPTVDHFNGLCVDKQAAKRFSSTLGSLHTMTFYLLIAPKPFFLDTGGIQVER